MKTEQLSIAARKGVSPAEFAVLIGVHHRGHMPMSQVARYAGWLDQPDGEPSPQRSQIEAAIDSCFRKGWLRVLTREDCEQDRVRWRDDPNQNCGEREYIEGNVDFS